MRICGFIGTTLIDFPGRVAAAIFVAGCNFRCPFCHNPSLVLEAASCDAIPAADILDTLTRRRGFLDGVIVSGGEPTIQPGILELLGDLRATGLEIKLDTNGSRPDVLNRVLEMKLADYISMDIKAVPERYSLAAGVAVDPEAIDQSIDRIIHSGCAHEFRTTVVPGIVFPEDISRIAARLAGADRFVLQQFRPDVTLDPQMKTVTPYPGDLLRRAARAVSGGFSAVDTRGA
ncbi:MAG: anaerobic ribonucleoside-triphosphate reductase activating protein [Acidobacteriota bacterium]|jgi:pyruvate formate lyase activating enzyme|nr:anaerobic ribonucleoside-triphosphate reductase activating protein [Acidobacteriota bacterium]